MNSVQLRPYRDGIGKYCVTEHFYKIHMITIDQLDLHRCEYVSLTLLYS